MSTFADVQNPSNAELAERYRRVAALLAHGPQEAAVSDAFTEWEAVRRAWTSHANLTRLRFAQDTAHEERRAAQREVDARQPGVTALETAAKRAFLGAGARQPLEPRIGGHAFDVWTADVACFDPAIATDMVREAELTREYMQLLASATARLGEEDLTLSELARYSSVPDRAARHAAERARWSIFERNGERLDALFDELVRLRARMATALGFADYTSLRYRKMRRTDYGPADVAAYRDEIARTVVPLARELLARGGAAAGLARVYLWDETALSKDSGVAPIGDLDWTLARTRDALAAIDPALGSFGEALFADGMFDVAARPGKRRGAFCTSIPVRNSPFIFTNYTGTGRDVRTLMHELGHAFQYWQSRSHVTIDYLQPTLEAAEIHSMALEFLSWPQMERFFGDRAAAYRRQHLFDSLQFLPYGAAVDHFQHLVYAHPSATPAERHQMWQEVERRYLPWRDYGDLAYPTKGGLWQDKQHIYVSPFYYIDYTLALCCALQFGQRSARDRTGALADYVALCGRGGEAPFQQLVRSANLASPFASGTLQAVVDEARASL